MHSQTIHILEDGQHVHALGHRVPLGNGGVAELKSRCLETLARLKEPPDEIRFARHDATAAAVVEAERDPPVPAPLPLAATGDKRRSRR